MLQTPPFYGTGTLSCWILEYQFLNYLLTESEFVGFENVLILDLYDVPFHAVIVFITDPRLFIQIQLATTYCAHQPAKYICSAEHSRRQTQLVVHAFFSTKLYC